MTVLALLGAKGLYILFAWLLSAIAASYLSGRKGYGERLGLASGLLLMVVGVVIWLVVPPRPDSQWRQLGPFGSGRREQPDAQEPGGPEPSGAGGTRGA
jgi:hypothetical protein